MDSSGFIKLTDAANYDGHEWRGDAHRALADADACLSVWDWILEN